MSDIFQEIDEDLRRENFAKLWQRFGKYVVALAVLAVLATAAVTGWREYQARQHRAEGVRYTAALDLVRQGKDAAAAEALETVARDSAPGRALVARFQEAALKAKANDAEGAVVLYDQIAQDGSASQPYRDLATLLGARYALEKFDPKAIIARLAPLTDANNPWHASALEITAMADIKAGDTTNARAAYQRLADDLAAPQALRARAAEMVTALAP